jgi:hypothetical protein
MEIIAFPWGAGSCLPRKDPRCAARPSDGPQNAQFTIGAFCFGVFLAHFRVKLFTSD